MSKNLQKAYSKFKKADKAFKNLPNPKKLASMEKYVKKMESVIDVFVSEVGESHPDVFVLRALLQKTKIELNSKRVANRIIQEYSK